MKDTKSIWNLATKHERDEIQRVQIAMNKLQLSLNDDIEKWFEFIKELYAIIKFIELRQT